MSDDEKPPQRKGPRRAGGPARGGAGSGGRKPGAKSGGAARFGSGETKPSRKRPDDGSPAKGFAKTPYAARDGDKGAARPGAGARKPYAPRRPAEGDERKPARARSDARPAFKPRPSDGERKPFAPGRDAPVEDGERIAKRLARVGIASRRDAEALIAAGRVKVNGRRLDTPAFNVTLDDVIELDGAPLPPVERTRLFLFHKPSGVVTTSRDPEGRKTVYDVLPTELPRLITVGRLDINTEGLMLLTNDGGLARTLELPATGWLRRYRVRVHGKVDEKQLANLREGVAVDGVFYGAIEATLDREQGSNAWLTLGFREGKNREVKNILGSLGLDVTRLIRISFGPFQLGELTEGQVQEIKGKLLRDQLGERLIAESGANFEADILKPFSNEPRRRGRDEAAPVEAAPQRPLRDEPPIRVGEGGLVKKRFKRANPRDEALGKLSTEKPRFERGERPDRSARPERGDRSDRGDGKPFGAKPAFGKPRGGKKEREQRPIEPPGGRKANVWMAPGSRPIGTGRAAAEKAEVEARRAGKKAAYGKPSGAKGRADLTKGINRPSSGPPAGPSRREKRGEGGSFNAAASLSPSSRGEGKGEGRIGRGVEPPPRKGGPGADRRR